MSDSSGVGRNAEEVLAIIEKIGGLPAILTPAFFEDDNRWFPLPEEFNSSEVREMIERAFLATPIGEVLVQRVVFSKEAESLQEVLEFIDNSDGLTVILWPAYIFGGENFYEIPKWAPLKEKIKLISKVFGKSVTAQILVQKIPLVR